MPLVSSHDGGWRKPAKFLGIDDKKKGSNPWSPGRVPSKATALGRKGTARERSFLSTIEFHFRSGMAAMEVDEAFEVVAGAKAAAEPAMARAAAMVFMVKMFERKDEDDEGGYHTTCIAARNHNLLES